MKLIPSRRVSVIRLLIVIGVIAHADPASAQSDEQTKALQDQRAIQATLTGFADKYMSVIAQAADQVSASLPDDARTRQLAHTYKLHSARAAIEIATQPNPEAALLDMLVFASLQRMAMQDQWASEVFGTQRHVFLNAMLRLEKEIWDQAARYLDAESRAELRALITEWRRQNPDTHYVFYVRFSDFAAARLESTLADKARKGGFLVDVSDVSRSADEAILLAERALTLTNRLPLLVSWEIESLYMRMAMSPEVRRALDQSGEMTRSMARFAASLEKLPGQVSAERAAAIEHLAEKLAAERGEAIRDVGTLLASERAAAIGNLHEVLVAERVAMLGELDARGEALSKAAEIIKTTLSDADRLTVHLGETTATINETIASADKLVGRFDREPGAAAAEASEPFDLASYVDAIRELTIAIQEANTLVLSAERIVGAEAPVAGMFDRVLWVGTLLIVILCTAAFFTMLIYRAAARRIFPDVDH